MRVLGWAFVLALAACGEVKNVDGGDGGSPDAASDFVLTVVPDNVFLRAGASQQFEVSVVRDGFGGDIVVSTSGLPEGVIAEALIIADGESTGTLTIAATNDSEQGDAQIAVTGDAPEGSGGTNVRLLVGGAPGTPDQSFSGGLVLNQFGLNLVAARGITLQADGKVVGTASALDRVVTYRLNQDGTVDTDFGEGGATATTFGDEPSAGGLVPAVLSNGQIIVAGWGGPIEGGYDSALYGYTSDGQLDTSFGSSGIISVDLGMGFDEFHGLLVDNNDGLLASGVAFTNNINSLRRYDSSGSFDDDYSVVASNGAFAQAAVLQADGKALLAGGSDGTFWVERHLTDGKLDLDFGAGGRASNDFEGATGFALGVAELTDGKILLSGISGTVLAVARYNSDGTLDMSFGDGGEVLTDIVLLVSSSGLNTMQVDSQGRILLSGVIAERVPVVVRLTADGTPDETFGNSGVVVLDFGIELGPQSGAFSLAIDPDDRVVVACDVGSPQQVGVARLWP